MKKIYVGTKTAVNFLYRQVQENHLEADLKFSKQVIGAINDSNPLNQRPGVIHVMAEALLPEFSIGYLAITKDKSYYSDSLSTVLSNIFGRMDNNVELAKYIASIEGTNYTRYIVRTRDYFGKAIFNEIMHAGDCIILACLAEDSTCFSHGINFSPAPDWDLIWDNDVKRIVNDYLHQPKREEPKEVINFDEPETVETNVSVDESDPLALFELLTPSTQNMVMSYAKKRAGLENMNINQLALFACIQKTGDSSIDDLIKLYFNGPK